MDTRNLLLGALAVLTVALASLTLVEYYQVNTLSERLQSQNRSTSTQTLTSTTTITTTRVVNNFITSTSSTTITTTVMLSSGSFTYAPAGQVKVDSVLAAQVMAVNGGTAEGEPVVTFAVTFENIGNSPIYIPDGSAGASSSIPSNSSVIHQVSTARCAGTFSIAKLNPGQNYTLYAPDCFTGFNYQLVRAGNVNVTFSFNWTTNANASTNPTDFPDTTTIVAQFFFP